MERSVAMRHLLQCEECMKRLPLPTSDEFWRCVMGNHEERADFENQGHIWSSIRDRFAGITFGQPAMKNAAAFGALLLLTILGISLLLMNSGGFRQDDDLVATVGNCNYPEIADIGNVNEAPGDRGPDTSPLSPDGPNSRTGNRKPATTTHRPSRNGSKRSNPTRDKEPRSAMSETRGGSRCNEQRTVGLEAKMTDAGLLVAWQKVKGAVSYDIYLSDLDERLLEHFETPDKTSHLVTAELNSETVYKLRLIVILESGERVVSESQNFKVGDLTKGSRSPGNIEIRKKTTASVRCVEVKQ